MSKKYRILLVLLLSIISFCCKTTEPLDTEGKVSIRADEVTCTEVWLKIHSDIEGSYKVLRNGISVGYLHTRDTLLLDDSLQPNTIYRYKLLNDKNELISRGEITARTMDTTSHGFTWQSWTFGGYFGSASLYGAEIIDENNIWVTGDFNLGDSLGNVDYEPYGLVHWDGVKWTPRKLYDPEGPIVSYIWTIKAFSPDNIWLSNGGVHQWDGASKKASKHFDRIIDLLGGEDNGQTVFTIWGTGSNDLYGGGQKGMLTHYNGKKWTKIPIGTERSIRKISGKISSETGRMEVFAIASDMNSSLEKEIISIKNDGSIEKLNTGNITAGLESMWMSGRNYYVGGVGLYKKHNIYSSTPWERVLVYGGREVVKYIDGTGVNDIMICGPSRQLAHFNGVSWKSYSQQFGTDSPNLYCVKIKGGIAVAVGSVGREAFIALGRR